METETKGMFPKGEGWEWQKKGRRNIVNNILSVHTDR